MILRILLAWAVAAVVKGQDEGDLHLAGAGSTYSRGRLEIYVNGTWGTVCNRHFDRTDAVVACRQLGFDTDGVQPIHSWSDQGSGFGAGQGPIWLTYVNCDGHERRLIDCAHSAPGAHDNTSACSHHDDVGVACVTPGATLTTTAKPVRISTGNDVMPSFGNRSAPGNVRLFGPSNKRYLGVVQIFHEGHGWMTVCDNNWNLLNAQVVCKELGFNTSPLPGGPSFPVSKVADPVMQAWINCRGSEGSLSECPAVPQPGSCQAHEKAVVNCNAKDCLCTQHNTHLHYSLECTGGYIRVTFWHDGGPAMQCSSFQLSNTDQPGQCSSECCNNGTGVTVSLPFDECGTYRNGNATHLLYSNSLTYIPYDLDSTWSITRESVTKVDLTCALPRVYTPSRAWHAVTERNLIVGTGVFHVRMEFCIDERFNAQYTQSPLQLVMGQQLFAKLVLTEIDKTTKLVVKDCFATPTPNYGDPRKHYLFVNKCHVDKTVSLYSLSSFDYGFCFEVFQFSSESVVYLHCNAIVCGLDERQDECDRSCRNASSPIGRRRRDSEDHEIIRVTGPAIYVVKNDTDPRTQLPPSALLQGTSGSSPSPLPGYLLPLLVICALSLRQWK